MANAEYGVRCPVVAKIKADSFGGEPCIVCHNRLINNIFYATILFQFSVHMYQFLATIHLSELSVFTGSYRILDNFNDYERQLPGTCGGTANRPAFHLSFTGPDRLPADGSQYRLAGGSVP